MKFNLKEYAWHGLGTMLMGGLFCVIVGSFSVVTDFFGSDDNPFDRFTDAYFYFSHSQEDEEMNFCPDIVMINLHGCDSRAAIAHKLDELNALHPRVIGMDAMYGDNSLTGKAEDDSLLHAAQRCSSLVTAERVVESTDVLSNIQVDHIEHSYYAQNGKVDEASINVVPGVVRNFNLYIDYDSLRVQTLVGRILERAYPDVYAKLKERGSDDILINYHSLMLDFFAFDDSLTADDIQDKVVLIGDFEDWRDFHDVPPTSYDGVEVQSRINGTVIYAFAIATAVQDKMINQMSDRSGWILGLILTYIFAIICCVIFVEFDELSGITTNVLMVLVMFILFIVGGWIFLKYNYSLNMAVSMLGIGAVGTTNEIWFWFCTTRPYLKVQEKLGLPDGGVRRYVNPADSESESNTANGIPSTPADAQSQEEKIDNENTIEKNTEN